MYLVSPQQRPPFYFVKLQIRLCWPLCAFINYIYLLTYYYLHSPSTASGACYRRSSCIDMDMFRLAALACCDKGWILAQRGVLCDWSVLKKTGSIINTEIGRSEHLLWHCLPDIPVAMHHNRFSEPLTTTHNWLFSEPPTLERVQQTFSQMKKLCNSQVRAVTFLGGVGRWITVFSSEITQIITSRYE